HQRQSRDPRSLSREHSPADRLSFRPGQGRPCGHQRAAGFSGKLPGGGGNIHSLWVCNPEALNHPFTLTPDEYQALWLSAKVAFWSTLICLPIGIGTSWLLARRDFPGKLLIEALVQLPMVLPPVVPGYLLLLLLGTQGPIGGWLFKHFNVVIAFTWK